MFALPVREGGMGMPLLYETAQDKFLASTTITAPLAAIIDMQGTHLPDKMEVKGIKLEDNRKEALDEKARIETIDAKLSPEPLRAIQQAREKGAASCLLARPSTEQGFVRNEKRRNFSMLFLYGTTN